jgi:hypothetical protein
MPGTGCFGGRLSGWAARFVCAAVVLGSATARADCIGYDYCVCDVPGVFEVTLVDAGPIAVPISGCAMQTAEVQLNRNWPGNSSPPPATLTGCAEELPLGVPLLLVDDPTAGPRVFPLDGGFQCGMFSLIQAEARALRESSTCHADLDARVMRRPFVCDDTPGPCGCVSAAAGSMAGLAWLVGRAARRRKA